MINLLSYGMLFFQFTDTCSDEVADILLQKFIIFTHSSAVNNGPL